MIVIDEEGLHAPSGLACLLTHCSLELSYDAESNADHAAQSCPGLPCS